MNSEQQEILARIDERLENVEGVVHTINRKLFFGNGNSVMTRLGILETTCKSKQCEAKEIKKGRTAVLIALLAGFISLLTSIGVAYVGK